MAVDDDNNKPYSIETEDHGHYLHVVVGGLRVTPEIALDYWRDIIDECESKSCSSTCRIRAVFF